MITNEIIKPGDLHLHLDGSLSAEWIMGVYDQNPTEKLRELLPFMETEHRKEELTKRLQAPEPCNDLNDYLTCFDLPLLFLQTEDHIESAVYDLIKRLATDPDPLAAGFAEIRFAPQLHTKQGLCQQAVLEAAQSAVWKAKQDYPTFDASLIACCMRMADNEAANLKTLEAVQTCNPSLVKALDLAGAEALYPTSQFEAIFQKASALGLPFTIHAGEAAGPESIWQALSFGATRIGHGVRCVEDASLVDYLIKHQIPLEVCPTSNVQTKAVASLQAHPLKQLLEAGVLVAINTDNMTVSNTTLSKEYQLITKLGLTNDQTKLIANSYKAKF